MKKAIPFAVAAIVFVAVIIAIANKSGGSVERISMGQVPGYEVNKSPEVAAAVIRAQRSLDDFIKEFKSPKPEDHGFGINAKFQTEKGPENIWIVLDSLSGDQFTGRLADEPFAIAGKRKGDSVTVKRDQISDWIYFQDKKQVGGFTIDAIKKSQP